MSFFKDWLSFWKKKGVVFTGGQIAQIEEYDKFSRSIEPQYLINSSDDQDNREDDID